MKNKKIRYSIVILYKQTESGSIILKYSIKKSYLSLLFRRTPRIATPYPKNGVIRVCDTDSESSRRAMKIGLGPEGVPPPLKKL